MKWFKKLFIILFSIVYCVSIAYSENLLKVPSSIDFILIIDQSGSMKNTDPSNARLEASKCLVNFLASHWREAFDHRLSIINFGTSVSEEHFQPLISLRKENLESIKQKIIPLDLGDTSFISALKKAAYEFNKEKEDFKRQRAILIFTDGEPDDPRKLKKEAYFKEISDFINKELQNIEIYIVAIDVKDSFWSRDKYYWEKILSGRTYHLKKMDERDLKKIFTEILLKILKTKEAKWDEIPPQGLDVEVEPYLELITFLILKENPEVKLTIIRDNGLILSGKDPDVSHIEGELEEVYSVVSPSPGIWKYRIEKGKGKVEVGKSVIPIEVRLLSPHSPYPKGKTMNIVANFLKRDGSIVNEHPAYRLWLGLKTIYPDGKEKSINLKHDGKGMYMAEEPIQTTQDGKYLISLSMKGGNLVIYQKDIPISVEPIPYLEISKPLAGSRFPLRKDVEIEVRLLKNTMIIDPSSEFIDNPNSLIWAQLLDEKGKAFKSFALNQMAQKGLFKGIILSSDIKKEGIYFILLQLSGKMKTGALFKAIPEQISFLKKMDIWDFLIIKWYLVLGLFVICLFIFDWQRIGRENEWWYWRIGAPALSGTIYIQDIANNEESLPIILSGRKKRLTRRGVAGFFQKADLGIIYAKKERNEEGSWESRIYFRPAEKSEDEIKIYDRYEANLGNIVLRYESE